MIAECLRLDPKVTRKSFGNDPIPGIVQRVFLDQLLDSINYPRHPFLSSLWAPVGLRFHALHHLFPSLPYHNLAKAHQRLMAELPAYSPYRLTNSPSLTASLVRLWRTSRSSAVKADPRGRGYPQRRNWANSVK